MEKPVLQRAMFMAVGTPKEESKGILSGFDEEMENDDYEDRTPDNLEIIANNLRGDIRSMDERYLELAQLVGEAAFETPEEVVVLMQSQMAPAQPQQGPGAGIGSLGAPPMPQQPQGIMQGIAEQPQPPMPPMPPQGGQAPIQMAYGGPVHRQLGSPPTGELGDFPEGARRLGFMRYLPQGTLAGPGEVPPRSVPIPRVVVQQTGPMTGFLSGEAAQYLQSGAGRPGGALPMRLSPGLRAATAVSEAGRNVLPFTREVTRTMMATPQGRAAAGLGLLGASTIPFLTGGEQAPEGGPVYSEVPGVDAQGRYTPVLRSLENMPGTTEEKAAVRQVMQPDVSGAGATFGMADLGAGPTGEDIMGMTGAEAAPPAAAVTAPKTTEAVPTPTVARPRTFKERVQDRIDIYKDVLGDDENMRQAQALFLLAEAALNVAGAPGRSLGERLAKGLKGLPAGMAALGEEKAKRDLAIRSAAVGAVESEMAAEAKSSTQLLLRMADLQSRNADVNTMANYLVQTQAMSQDKALQFARLFKAGAIKQNEAGETVDMTGRVIHSPFRLVEGDVGFLPSNMPFVESGQRTLVPATTKERPALAEQMANNQQMAASIERVMQLPAFETMFGPVARIQSGATTLLTPIFGSNVPFTSLPKQVQENMAMELRNELIQLNARNTSRPSVWEQQQVEKFVADPKAILTSPDEFFGVLNNFRIKSINAANQADHRLNGTPLKQLGYIPLGTAKDPLQAKDSGYLPEFFRLRPNGEVYIQLPSEKSPRKFTAQEYFKQTGQ